MNRKIYYWKLRGTELQLGERTLIMGVLNVTPDSFSDGGRFSDPDRAYARALEMEEQGADIIDIGAESTRPDSKRISADEEWQRLVPVLKLLRGKLTVPLSLDTYKSEVAERALQYGVEILNDPSGLTFDADLAKVAVQGDAGLILNHMRGLPETWAKLPPMPDVIGTIAKELEATTSRARRAGVEKNRIMVDPGRLSDSGRTFTKVVSRAGHGRGDGVCHGRRGDGGNSERRPHGARTRCKRDADRGADSR